MKFIEHRDYGKGKVLKERYGGLELYVEFDDGIKRWVRNGLKIRFLSSTPILKAESPKSEPALSDTQFKARAIIEALRLGIVPYRYIEEFTYGRAEEIKIIEDWLSSKYGTMAIIGEYGVGKTHLLEYIYGLTIKKNWAVTRINLDINETPFHKPKAIYEKLIQAFKFKDGGFREFLRSIATSDSYNSILEHSYLGKAAQIIREGADTEYYGEWFWDWIEGRSSRKFKPQMYHYSTCANIYTYIISGIGWAARNILHLKGFLILFDEAESAKSDLYSQYQDSKARNFIKGLILMANNDSRLLREKVIPKYDYVYSSGYKLRTISRGKWGVETGLQYCARFPIPFLWRKPCYTKLLFAMTYSPILEKEPFNSLHFFELEHLDSLTLQKILASVLQLYSIAYSFNVGNLHIPVNNKAKTRYQIKRVIEALDIIRFNPDKSLHELLQS